MIEPVKWRSVGFLSDFNIFKNYSQILDILVEVKCQFILFSFQKDS